MESWDLKAIQLLFTALTNLKDFFAVLAEGHWIFGFDKVRLTEENDAIVALEFLKYFP